MSRTGRCLCGAVTFAAAGEPGWVGICHCESCRRATGGVLVAAAGYKRDAVRFAGAAPMAYESSPGALRRFCARCGTALSYESEQWPDDVHLMVGAFDRPQDLAPRFHVFAQERLPWLRVADDLPRFRTTPSAGEVLPDRED
ncbi:MAG: GFA family protein [Alphaproteobacteria bacterium]|nr:GFA family protein [Alphaproteobacteria bacterium]